MIDYDLVVIGGGAGGLSAARTARREGVRVALVNDGPLGGDCTFTGCVPSKTLIESAAAGHSFDSALATVAAVVERIAGTENADVLRGEGIDVIEGRARFTSPKRIDVDGTPVGSPKFVIATGSRPALPPIPGLAEIGALTNETIFEPRSRPGSLGVLGAGPIGCELAQAFARLGVAVTVFEMADRVLLREEPEASEIIATALRSDAVDLRLGRPVVGVRPAATGSTVEIEGGTTVDVDEVLVAVGRVPVTESLALEIPGVELTARGHIETDHRLATSADHIWAVGDVTENLPFTHAADEMGRLAAWNAVKRFSRASFNPAWIPWATFTQPEVARVGVLEAEAPAGARVAFLPMSENDRAITAAATDGFVKLIVGPRRMLRNLGGGQVIGATIVGPRAGEMIHEPTLAMRTKMFAGRLAQTVHAYPSWSIGIQKAAGQLFFEIEGREARPVRRP
ncbi:MAG: FAD-dependent oxidoreductase [Acidimicrobiia bacterium]|nr:FAD-dependent oxidoreductase [Acidimicrobiia bacterium]